MRSRFGRLVVALVSCSLLPLVARAADDDIQLSDVAVRTLSSQTILYKEVETTLQQIGPSSAPILAELGKLVKDKKVVYDGCFIFVYHGVTEDPNNKFKLQVGIAVPEGTAAQGEFKIEKLQPLKAATILYGGPILSVARAYEKLFGNLGGKQPSGVNREYYYRWEGPESKNNVELIAVGVE